MWEGSGACTRIPWILGFLLYSSIFLMSSSSLTSLGSSQRENVIPTPSQARRFIVIYDRLAGLSPTRMTARWGLVGLSETFLRMYSWTVCAIERQSRSMREVVKSWVEDSEKWRKYKFWVNEKHPACAWCLSVWAEEAAHFRARRSSCLRSVFAEPEPTFNGIHGGSTASCVNHAAGIRECDGVFVVTVGMPTTTLLVRPMGRSDDSFPTRDLIGCNGHRWILPEKFYNDGIVNVPISRSSYSRALSPNCQIYFSDFSSRVELLFHLISIQCVCL